MNDANFSFKQMHALKMLPVHGRRFLGPASQWLIGNMINNSLTQTGAFEIYSNDQLVSAQPSSHCAHVMDAIRMPTVGFLVCVFRSSFPLSS